MQRCLSEQRARKYHISINAHFWVRNVCGDSLCLIKRFNRINCITRSARSAGLPVCLHMSFGSGNMNSRKSGPSEPRLASVCTPGEILKSSLKLNTFFMIKNIPLKAPGSSLNHVNPVYCHRFWPRFGWSLNESKPFCPEDG